MMKYVAKYEDKCTQCGVCETTCSTQYFKEDNAEKSRIQVEKDGDPVIRVCNQCGECVDVCPRMALERKKNGVVVLNEKKCIGCLTCVGFCPEEALFYVKGEGYPFKCISCGLCTKECPTEAIVLEEA